MTRNLGPIILLGICLVVVAAFAAAVLLLVTAILVSAS